MRVGRLEKDSIESVPLPGMRREWIFVTCEMCSKWLSDSKAAGYENCRRIEWRIHKYARDIKAGLWVYAQDPFPMMITGRGILANGWHRAEACIKAGCGFWTEVIFDYPVEYIRHLDQNAIRTFPMILRQMGVKHHREVAASVNLIWKYQHSTVSSEWSTPDSDQGMDWYLTNRVELDPFISHTIKIKGKADLPASMVAAVLWETRFATCANGRDFVDALLIEASVPEDDPRAVLRRRLREDKLAKTKMTRYWHRFALTIKAWNLWVQGERCRCLTFRPAYEKYPKFITEL